MSASRSRSRTQAEAEDSRSRSRSRSLPRKSRIFYRSRSMSAPTLSAQKNPIEEIIEQSSFHQRSPYHSYRTLPRDVIRRVSSYVPSDPAELASLGLTGMLEVLYEKQGLPTTPNLLGIALQYDQYPTAYWLFEIEYPFPEEYFNVDYIRLLMQHQDLQKASFILMLYPKLRDELIRVPFIFEDAIIHRRWDLMKWLHDEVQYPLEELNPEITDHLIRNNELGILQYIHSIYPTLFRDQPYNEFLSTAIQEGNLEMIQYIYDQGYTANDELLMLDAISTGDSRVVQWVVDHEFQPPLNSKNISDIFEYAIESGGELSFLQYIMSLGYDHSVNRQVVQSLAEQHPNPQVRHFILHTLGYSTHSP